MNERFPFFGGYLNRVTYVIDQRITRIIQTRFIYDISLELLAFSTKQKYKNTSEVATTHLGMCAKGFCYMSVVSEADFTRQMYGDRHDWIIGLI